MSDSSKKEKNKKKQSLPANLEEKKNKVQIGNISPSDTSTYESHDVYESVGYDNKFDLEEFKEQFSIKIINITEEQVIFDLIGIDAPVANAFRRILLAEIPIMAIETVFMIDNTGVMQDEVLCHRLGLIPIRADPSRFEEKREADEPADNNTIVFELNVGCRRNASAPDDAPADEKYINGKVFSRDLIWKPQGIQSETFLDDPIRPVHGDILITKMRPGQRLTFEARCVKGIGQTHAKWSPVSTATYRLMPEITLLKTIKNQEADELVNLCPMKVFDIEELGNERKAVVKYPRSCTMCRECIRDVKWQDKVKLARIKKHFIFDIESTGSIPAPKLFIESIQILRHKCVVLDTELAKLNPSFQ